MVKAQPLVSVLVATYNGEKFLDETLRAIRKQSYKRLEIIVRDDRSTDGTFELASQHAARDSRIKLLQAPENAGGYENYLQLTRMARGQFIKFCNQDDVLDPSCVQTLLAPMLRPSRIRVVLSSSTRRLIDESGNELPPADFTAPLASRDCIVGGSAVIDHTVFRAINQIGEPSTTLFRNGLVAPEDMFTFAGVATRVNVDVALWLNLLTKGGLYFHVAPLSSFRIHGSQFSAHLAHQVEGALEWVGLLTACLEQGLVPRGSESAAAVSRWSNDLQQILATVHNSDDPNLTRFEDGIRKAMDSLALIDQPKVVQTV